MIFYKKSLTQYLDRYDLVLQRLFFYKLLLILIRYIVIRGYRAIYTVQFI